MGLDFTVVVCKISETGENERIDDLEAGVPLSDVLQLLTWLERRILERSH